MARPLRVEYPGAFYHVINRGNAGEDIYINERDREKFLEYLANLLNYDHKHYYLILQL